MTLQIHNGNLLIDSGSLANHADCCCEEGCPDLGSTDWYLYICPGPGSPSTWCPTTGITDTAVNLGTLSMGLNTISIGALSCPSMTYSYGCNGSTIYSCTRSLTSGGSYLDITVSAGTPDGYDFDLRYYSTFNSWSDCSSNPLSNFSSELIDTTTVSKCRSGVYSFGEYRLYGIISSVFNCDGMGAIGAVGFNLPASLSASPLANFVIAPSGSLPPC